MLRIFPPEAPIFSFSLGTDFRYLQEHFKKKFLLPISIKNKKPQIGAKNGENDTFLHLDIAEKLCYLHLRQTN